MGALSKLIERTPRFLVSEYRCLLGKLTARLDPLLRPEIAPPGQHKSVQLIVDLLALIQAIVMNVRGEVGAQGGTLLRMLVIASRNRRDLAGDLLPAIGALARAVKGEFAPYLEELLGLVLGFLESRQYVRPAAVFVSDILCSGVTLDAALVGRIAASLTLEFDHFDVLGYEAKLAVFTALSDLAKYLGGESSAWLDRYLDLLEQEARIVLNLEDETVEAHQARSFAAVCLQIYQALVPILAGLKRGDRKVRNFFHIFEQLLRIDCIDDALLADCVVLISAIAETFKRKMNVFLNKPAVLELLRRAEESESPRLAALGESTWKIVKSF
jgi:hypothetical protein